jgi:hypothetical protein
MAKVENSENKKTKKEKKAKEPKQVKFPVNSKINPYGFIFMKKSWLEALGWTKGMVLRIEKNTDGSIAVRKV